MYLNLGFFFLEAFKKALVVWDPLLSSYDFDFFTILLLTFKII